MEIHSLLGLFPCLPVNMLEDVKKAEFQICSGWSTNLNEEEKSIVFQTTNFPPDDFKAIATLSFYKMLTGKW